MDCRQIEIMKKESASDPSGYYDANLDGIRATRKIRETSSVPIIMLSAKSEDVDKDPWAEHRCRRLYYKTI